jgi:hypothetical protein
MKNLFGICETCSENKHACYHESEFQRVSENGADIASPAFVLLSLEGPPLGLHIVVILQLRVGFCMENPGHAGPDRTRMQQPHRYPFTRSLQENAERSFNVPVSCFSVPAYPICIE